MNQTRRPGMGNRRLRSFCLKSAASPLLPARLTRSNIPSSALRKVRGPQPSEKPSPKYTRRTSTSLPSSRGVPVRKMRPSAMMYARSVTLSVSRTL